MIATQAVSHVVFDLDSLDALRFSRPKGMISLSRFERRFGYSAERLETLASMPAGSARANPFATRLQRFMTVALDIVALRMLQCADLDEAIAWFKQQPLDQFERRTAEQVVADGSGASLAQMLGKHAPIH